MSADVLDGQTCWIVGQAVKDEHGSYENGAWLFQGVFSTEGAALAACRGQQYFIGPAVMDEVLPDEVTDWAGSYYPWAGRPDEDPE